eukprot:CAMPEP_0174349656 /NCGR_PEP_ID=MMETSP0811_2-20130205/6441_1 /TAXON_ID=73025 ORGANISM="Eutreptiella gymnastica-like, Strain CCMP1594" /NCGR_SAMPLE_ID=MMETSP0811_2 /ASSEMBLY_ACC=CAM_ASM_000667 /LENGTH=44 /DNA_ID= /DNA_START= /DNA_END= /DNA_ORIENTATION=
MESPNWGGADIDKAKQEAHCSPCPYNVQFWRSQNGDNDDMENSR